MHQENALIPTPHGAFSVEGILGYPSISSPLQPPAHTPSQPPQICRPLVHQEKALILAPPGVFSAKVVSQYPLQNLFLRAHTPRPQTITPQSTHCTVARTTSVSLTERPKTRETTPVHAQYQSHPLAILSCGVDRFFLTSVSYTDPQRSGNTPCCCDNSP